VRDPPGRWDRKSGEREKRKEKNESNLHDLKNFSNLALKK